MIKEISKITKESKYVAVVKNSDCVDMRTVEPDTFVEDDFSAEYSLQKAIIDICKETDSVKTLEHRRFDIPADAGKIEHYQNIIDEATHQASLIIHRNTKQFRPNYTICSADWLPIFALTRDFVRTKNVCPIMGGTYLAGTYKDIPVLISPAVDRGEMLWGVNNETTSGVVTFLNDENKICNRIVDSSCFTLLKLED